MKYLWLRKLTGGGKLLASLIYLKTFKRPLNWWRPQTINEKINWLKFNTDTSEWSRLSDKFKVREFVKGKGYEANLVKLYGHWDNPDDIEWEKLPDSFVLKMNNGSGDVIICKDKSSLDKNQVMAHFKDLFANTYDYTNAEPHYTKIKPCLIAEELLDASKQAFPSSSLIDYKIWCFNGKPDFVWLAFNRRKGYLEVAPYDLDWNFHPEYEAETPHYSIAKVELPRPESLDKMLKMAKDLATGFPEVRVDLYEVGGHVYFGEMTFTSAGGFMRYFTFKQLLAMGEKVTLPTKNK